MMCGTERFKEVENKGVVEMAEKKICTHPGCTSNVLKEHLCWKHLTERDGKPPYCAKGDTPRPRCIVPDCDKLRWRNLMCKRHHTEAMGFHADVTAPVVETKQPANNDSPPCRDGIEKEISSVKILTIEIEGCKTISIDFSQYPDLYKSLCDMARVEFRLPEEQILFLISQAEKIVSAAMVRG
jgi:hypothetical protein